MRVEVVEITGDMSARITAPRVRLGVKATMEKVQGLVWVDDVAVGAGVSVGHGYLVHGWEHEGGRRRVLPQPGSLVQSGTRRVRPGRTRGRRVPSRVERRNRSRFPNTEIFNLWIILLHSVAALLFDGEERPLWRLAAGRRVCRRRRDTLRRRLSRLVQHLDI